MSTVRVRDLLIHADAIINHTVGQGYVADIQTPHDDPELSAPVAVVALDSDYREVLLSAIARRAKSLDPAHVVAVALELAFGIDATARVAAIISDPAHADGFTLTLPGLTLATPETTPTLTGYMVGGVIPAWEPDRETLGQWVTRALSVAHSRPLAIGGWRDETGRYWIDLCEVVTDLADALNIARERGELAVGRFLDGAFLESVPA